MKKLGLPLIALLMILSLAACGSGDDQLKKLNGTWAVDIEASLSGDESMKAMSQEERDFAMAMAKAMLESMALQFDVDKKEMTLILGPEKKSQSFTVKSVSGKTIMIESDGKPLNIEFKSDDSLIFSGDDGKKLIFARKK